MYTFEASFFTSCLEQAMFGPAEPNILKQCQVGDNIDVPKAQNRAFWLAYGFNTLNRQSNVTASFLRFQAQAERLYRRAVEDFDRLRKLRDQLPPEQYETPNEPNLEPTAAPQPSGNTALPDTAPAIPPTQIEPNTPALVPPNPPTSPAANPSAITIGKVETPVHRSGRIRALRLPLRGAFVRPTRPHCQTPPLHRRGAALQFLLHQQQ